jgi:zinc transport system substrate-binding protein
MTMHYWFKRLIFITACLFSIANGSENDKPTVLVSLAPYEWFVQQLAGSSVHVEVLVPPGASFHTYEPRLRQALKISNAKLWLRLGDPAEAKALEAMEGQNPLMKLVDLRKGLPLIGKGAGFDPHIWLSVRLVKTQAETMASALIDLMPSEQAKIVGRLQVLLEKLDALDHEIIKILSDLKPRVVVVSHPAYAYFCRDYHLKQIAIEQAGKEPSIGQLTRISDEIQQLGVDTIFVQVQHNPKSVEVLADRIGAQVVKLDPMQKDYPTMMRKIARRFAGK